MIRIIVAAVWICAVTAGSIYYGFHASGEQSEQENTPAFFGGLDYVRTGVTSVPLFSNGTVSGYFVTRLVYTVDPQVKAALTIPPEALLIDQLYTYLYSNPQLDFSKRDTLDLDLLRSSIRDAINERVGEKLVHEVLVEQVDYLPKESVRDNAARRRLMPERGDITHSAFRDN